MGLPIYYGMGHHPPDRYRPFKGHARDIAARATETRDKTYGDWVLAMDEHDANACSCGLGRAR